MGGSGSKPAENKAPEVVIPAPVTNTTDPVDNTDPFDPNTPTPVDPTPPVGGAGADDIKALMATTVELQQKLADDADTSYILKFFFPIIGAWMNLINIFSEADVVDNTQQILAYFANSQGGASDVFNTNFAANAEYTFNKIGYTRSTYWLHQLGVLGDIPFILNTLNPIFWIIGGPIWLFGFLLVPEYHFAYIWGMDSNNYIQFANEMQM